MYLYVHSSSCCFCTDKFRSPCNEYLSIPPFLSSGPSKTSCLLPVLFCYFCFKPPLLQTSILIIETKNISCDPGIFHATFLPKCLTVSNQQLFLELWKRQIWIAPICHSYKSTKQSHRKYIAFYIEELTRVVFLYEIYETSLRRVS